MKIAILGATGMLGSMVLNVFKETTDYELIATAREERDFDNQFVWRLLDAQTSTIETLAEVIQDCNWVINCIGIIKPYIHDDNAFEIQQAIEVNSLFPCKLAKAAELTGTKVIQIATDCVYDGKKGKYLETDTHNALDVYGKTKSLGEVYSKNVMNLRCSIIGPEKRGKTSLLEWFLNQPKNAKLNGFSNHLWNGISTYHFAKICTGVIKNDFEFNHIQHIVPADFVSKAQMLHDFKEIFGRNDIEITDVSAQEAFDRTILTLNEDKNFLLWKLGGYNSLPTIREMLEELKDARI